MERITLELDDADVAAIESSPEEAGEAIRLAAAMMYFRLKKLSSGAAARLAGISKPEFLQRLAEFDIDTFDLSKSELESDIRHADPGSR